MSYIGNTNTTQGFIPAVDYFNGTGSQTAFTLSRPVASVAQVQAVIENVPQNPGSAFTVSGSTITFTSAPPSGTSNIYVYYTSPITQVIQPGQGTVGTSQLAGGTVSTTADITANGITVGKGAGSVSTNTAVGASALATNSTGSGTTAVGYYSLNLSTGNDNTALGYYSMSNNSTGINNTGLGRGALFYNTTGGYNTAVGMQALVNNTTANNNTAVGYQTLYAATTGGYNTAIGYQAGKALTSTGPSGNVAANTLVGAFAGFSLTTGYGNTIVGAYDNSTNAAAGYFITTGNNNTILGGYNGNQGGLDIRTASNYIVLSDGAGNPRGFFDGSTFYCTGIYNTTTSNGANVFVYSNGALARSTSALKYKQDIRDIEEIDINLLRPVRYKSKCDMDDQTRDHFGVIADEVDAAGIKELVNYGADGEIEGFQYERLTVVLLKSLQTLKADLDATKAELAALKGPQ